MVRDKRLNHEVLPVGCQLNGPVEIGAKNVDPQIPVAIQHLGMGKSKAAVAATGYHHHLWVYFCYELVAAR